MFMMEEKHQIASKSLGEECVRLRAVLYDIAIIQQNGSKRGYEVPQILFPILQSVLNLRRKACPKKPPSPC